MAVTRKAHVVRIYGQDRSGTRSTDVYADILRTDELIISAKDQHGWQMVRLTFVWDDEQDAELNNIEARETHTLKLWDPSGPQPADPLDPDSWIPVEVIDSYVIKGWAGAYYTFKPEDITEKYHQETKMYLWNQWDGTADTQAATTRKVNNVRVIFRATTADTDLTSDDGTSRKVDAENYQLIDDASTNDAASYLEEEILKQYFNVWHIQETKMAHVFITDPDDGDSIFNVIQFMADDATGFNDTGDVIIPYRFDPFQTVVNICWGALAVEFFPGSK